MKKALGILLLVALVASIASVVVARTLEEERDAVRAYLTVVDAKIIKFRKAGNTAKMKVLQAEKAGTLRRWEKLKAQLESAQVPTPPAAPTTPPPPAAPAKPAAVGGGMFGWGLNTGATLGYSMGKSVITGRADMILADPMGLGSMIGLSADAVNWKVGLGGAMGKDINDKDAKAIPLFVDGILNLPADMLGGIKSYVGAGVNYVLYGSGRVSGSYGGQIYYGIQGDVGLGGQSYVELGYSIIRSGAITNPYSMKGVGINFGTQLML